MKRTDTIEPATIEEIERLTKGMPPRLQLKVLLGAWCQMRFGEIGALRRKDIDLKNNVIKVRRGQPAAQTHGMLSLAEAAELAGISFKTLRHRIAEGALPAFRTGPRLIRVYPEDLAALAKPINAAAVERVDSGSRDAVPDDWTRRLHDRRSLGAGQRLQRQN